MGKGYLFPIAFISWMVLVTFSSLYSFGGDELPRFEIPHFDKVVHFGFYFVGAILGTLSFQGRTRDGIFPRTWVWWLVLGLSAFGIFIEFLQQEFTTSRMGDGYDALANAMGAVMGALMARLLFFSKKGLN